MVFLGCFSWLVFGGNWVFYVVLWWLLSGFGVT